MSTSKDKYKVLVYQRLDDIDTVPFWAEIINDFGSRWEVTYINKYKTSIIRNINKGCCSSEPIKIRRRTKNEDKNL